MLFLYEVFCMQHLGNSLSCSSYLKEWQFCHSWFSCWCHILLKGRVHKYKWQKMCPPACRCPVYCILESRP
jgi:hypothetical protein